MKNCVAIPFVTIVAALSGAFAMPAAVAGTATSQQADALVGLIDATRVQHGVRPLHRSRLLDRSASLKASEIRRCNSFSHTPCGMSFTRTFQIAGYRRHKRMGENLYWGSGGLSSPSSAIAAWLNSPPHRANLLGRAWRELGVSAVYSPSMFGAQGVWLYVLQFGA